MIIIKNVVHKRRNSFKCFVHFLLNIFAVCATRNSFVQQSAKLICKQLLQKIIFKENFSVGFVNFYVRDSPQCETTKLFLRVMRVSE